jgi:hypothetical protein
MSEKTRMEKSELNRHKLELLRFAFGKLLDHNEIYNYKYKELFTNIHVCETQAIVFVQTVTERIQEHLGDKNFLEKHADLNSFLYEEFSNQIKISAEDWVDKGEMSFFIERIIRNIINFLRDVRSEVNVLLKNRSISNMDYDFGLKLFTIPVEKSLRYKIDNRLIYLKLKCPRVGHIINLGFEDMSVFYEKIRQSGKSISKRELN